MGRVKIKAPRGVGCGERVSPSPSGEGYGEGAVPPPQKNFPFFASKSHVCDALYYWLKMNNSAQNGSFCNVTDNQILLMDPGQDAFYHASNRTPQMVGFAQIVRVNCPSRLRVVRERLNI